MHDRESESRLHVPVLATAGAECRPDARTVAIESVDPATRRLFVNTDRRSPKMMELDAIPEVMLVFCEGQTQVRARATATLHYEDAVARRSWEALPLEQRTHFLSDLPPGTPISHSWAMQTYRLPRDPDEGYEHYAVIEAQVTHLDWLRYEPTGPRRAAFHWKDDGNVASQWLMP